MMLVKTPLLLIYCIAAFLLQASSVMAQSRDYIRITGSSSVYPFSTAVAEEFGRISTFKTPIVEGIGTGAGFKLFCSGLGLHTPDIVNASRPIKQSEAESCIKNNVNDLVEIKFGYDGIIFANSKSRPQMKLTLKQLFMAMAAYVPQKGTQGESGKLVKNPYKKWSDISIDLPDHPIQIFGPPPTSGTRDTLAETVMQIGCEQFTGLRELKISDPAQFKNYCHSFREDGIYIESGENDNIVVQKIMNNPDALGIFAFSYLDQNKSQLQASAISVTHSLYIEPTFDAISMGNYPVFRSLYFYVKKAHIPFIKGMKEFIDEYTKDGTWGDYGYLLEYGLIPMNEHERRTYRGLAENDIIYK